jgi:hypothetical protein
MRETSSRRSLLGHSGLRTRMWWRVSRLCPPSEAPASRKSRTHNFVDRHLYLNTDIISAAQAGIKASNKDSNAPHMSCGRTAAKNSSVVVCICEAVQAIATPTLPTDPTGSRPRTSAPRTLQILPFSSCELLASLSRRPIPLPPAYIDIDEISRKQLKHLSDFGSRRRR